MNAFRLLKSFAGLAFIFPLALFAAPTVSSTSTPPPATSEPKTHTLFMGTDVVVERDKKLCRVWDVEGSSFVVTLDGARTTVPMGGGSHHLKLEQTVKLSSASASLSGLKGERTYTPGNDPRMRRQKEKMAVTVAMEDAAEISISHFVTAQDTLNYLNSGIPKSDLAAWQAAVDQAQSRLDSAAHANALETSAMASDLTSGAAIRSRAENDLAFENFDAVEISFEISSETPLTNPYLVAITRFLPRNAKTGMSPNNAIYAKELKPIGNKPQKIDFTQGGFPWGYTLEGYEVHLYDHGIEIATNVAPNRVALTREEAFLYLKIEYLNKHKGDTLPASLAMKKVFPGGKSANASDQSSGFCFVRVSKEGLPLAAYADEACTRPVDTHTESIAANFRFFPALDKGKQVEGVARLILPKHEV